MKIKDLKKKLPCSKPDLDDILSRLKDLHKDIILADKKYKFKKHHIQEEHRASAENLVQYLALRKHDIRKLQLELTNWGISSLGRVERKVLASVNTVILLISHLLNKDWEPSKNPPICFDEARRKLEQNSNRLLGKMPKNRRARIMVTMPTSAAYDKDFVQGLLSNGMNIARINCAHDNEEIWLKIIQNIQEAENVTASSCRIHMDLGGPKLRTGPIEPGPAVRKIRPKKDSWGKITDPVLQFFQFGNQKATSLNDFIPIKIFEDIELLPDDVVHLRDTRDSKRKLVIKSVEKDGFWAWVTKTTYFAEGIKLFSTSGYQIGEVGPIPAQEGYLLLKVGDTLLIHRDPILGKNKIMNTKGREVQPARISCTLREALNNTKVNQRIWFDDGKIEGIIKDVQEEFIAIEVLWAKENGTKLRAEKGINLPNTKLKFSAVTEKDKKDLDFVLKHADTVGLSFANRPKDVRTIIYEMRQRTDKLPGLILKIETNNAFYNLPRMMLEAMSIPSAGVMIARGDLAIECGFGRLAELQEEILWISEAGHLPVVWATQVLESLAKTGFQTRAEVSDASLGQRAECIMLNKGPHIIKATTRLDEILQRMQSHQTKKRSDNRKLKLAEDFFRQDRMIHF